MWGWIETHHHAAVQVWRLGSSKPDMILKHDGAGSVTCLDYCGARRARRADRPIVVNLAHAWSLSGPQLCAAAHQDATGTSSHVGSRPALKGRDV